MLKNLHIKNFRGFRDLKIESLKRINLIIGQNNTGKTGVLEALALLLDNQTQTFRANLPNLFRAAGNYSDENFWRWLFRNKDQRQNARVEASLNGGTFTIILRGSQGPIDFNPAQFGDAGHFGTVSYHLTFGKAHAGLKPAIFSTHPSNPAQDAIDYNRVIVKRRKKQVEKMLREIEPRLETLEALQIGQPGQAPSPLIYADIGLSEMIPVTQLGQGFNRLLDIYSEIVVEDAKVLLIDEIENGLHYSVMPIIWKGLFLAAKEFDVQIFATTHSWECILAADQAARAEKEYDLALIRLDRVKDDIKATVIDEKSMSTAKELHWEMR